MDAPSRPHDEWPEDDRLRLERLLGNDLPVAENMMTEAEAVVLAVDAEPSAETVPDAVAQIRRSAQAYRKLAEALEMKARYREEWAGIWERNNP